MINTNELQELMSVESEFTIGKYKKLIATAKDKFTFTDYSTIPWAEKFILWRHDCDCSLNRSFELALIEASEGVKATYFINPHCIFYNIFEKTQYQMVMRILEMGHDIGLHFDADFYCDFKVEKLDELVHTESQILERLYGVKTSAFSFHNPNKMLLKCEDKYYGGLINCYSSQFKNEVTYCSDSNGYWRYRTLEDVLTDVSVKNLQVLTHPEWWQETNMQPRDRIIRSINGRAKANLQEYDEILKKSNRRNIGLLGSDIFSNTGIIDS